MARRNTPEVGYCALRTACRPHMAQSDIVRLGHARLLLKVLRQALADLEQKTLQPIDNPFGTRVSPLS